MEKLDASRACWVQDAFVFITCKERKREHPNMLSVHDRSQESSSIDLLEVDMG
jgi:hypothetical protein